MNSFAAFSSGNSSTLQQLPAGGVGLRTVSREFYLFRSVTTFIQVSVSCRFLTTLSPVSFFSPGHLGWSVRRLPGPGGGALPVQPVGPGAETRRSCCPGRMQLLGTREHRPLDRPRCRCLQRRNQGVHGPLSRSTEIQSLQHKSVRGDGERWLAGGVVS